MDPAFFDELAESCATQGPAAAIERLCAGLRERKDYGGLFYALLLKKRFELGVSPIPSGPAQELPVEAHETYEDGIREAGRLVGRLFLDEGNIPRAWVYFRMLGEPEPVVEALEKLPLDDRDDMQQVVEIAYHQGVHPRKGFDLILERFGLCNAITTASGQDPNMPADVREHCLKRLVRALYRELGERLRAEIDPVEGAIPNTTSVRELMRGHDHLFQGEFYHIDVSHLSAVVQMSIYLPRGEELELARELCEYGAKLSPRLQGAGEPPFENHYKDYGVYLAVIAGHDVERGLAHFREKVERADPDTEGTRPAEVLVNLLLRLDRTKEALGLARKHLRGLDNQQMLSCPSLSELCQKAKDFQALAEIAREQSDPVHFLAGLIGNLENRPVV